MFYTQAKTTNFDFKLVQDYSFMDKQYDIDGGLFSKSEFLYNSSSINSHIRHYVIEASSKDEILANFYFQVMPFKGGELKSYIPDGEDCILNKTMEAIVDLALERVNWNLAVLGNVFITGDNGQYWRKANLAPEIKWEIVEKAAKFLSTQLDVDAFLLSDLREEELSGNQAILNKGYRNFEVEPDLIFDIDANWNSFEDYLESVVSKYRVRTKKVLEKSEQLVIKNLELSDLKSQEKEIYHLYKNVMDSAAFKLAEVNQEYFFQFKTAYPNQFFVRGFYLNDILVGVISYFDNQDSLFMNFVGLDYSYNREHSVYQRILYDAIEQGILKGKKHIHFGRTASEIKTSVGAKPVKAFSLLKHNNKIPNLAIKPLTTYLKPEPFEVRKPFKSKVEVSN